MNEPKFDDVADTLTASFRTMKETSAQLEALTGTVYVILAFMFIVCAICMFTLWKVTNNA